MKKEFVDIVRGNELVVEGFCDNKKREILFEEALLKLQDNPNDWAKEDYYGIKNYAGFGDQREDHKYGYGPRHGSIVFSIGRGGGYNSTRKDVYVEFLLYFRDFRNDKVKSNGDRYNQYNLDLQDVLRRKISIEEELEKINQVLT